MGQYDFRKDIHQIIKKYVAGTATEEEIKFVEAYYTYLEKNKTQELSANELEQLRTGTYQKITQQINGPTKSSTRIVKLYKYAAVAALLAIAITTAYWFLTNTPATQKQTYAVQKPLDITPGTNQAILTLADGSRIILDNKANSTLVKQPGLIVSKTQNGQLVYHVSGHTTNTQNVANNTVSTPKGGQYQIILPDGTKVWLNAASSLTYPEIFTGHIRRVALQGEGYFEVAKNKAMPFHVITGAQDIEVTGTHFNINGYMDDLSINTTLLEGSVIVHNAGIDKKIIPGEQAMVFNSPALIKVKPVDTDEEVAWKNGLFQFNNVHLKTILNQLERWYNIEIDYSHVPAKRYSGMVPRSANLSEVLKMLELTGNIKFRIEPGRKLKVTNN